MLLLSTGLPSLLSVTQDYDYSGIRVSQTVNGVEMRFLVDKNRNYAQVLAEYAPSGTVQVSYVFGSDLIAQDRNGTKSFYVYDGLGSTRALTDATGNVTDTYNYDAYGNLSSSTGTTVNSYLYAGEQFDKNLGDYYLRDRYYSTDIGRFTQSDRFAGDFNNPLSLNKYGYTHGNPVNGTDPSGMFLLSGEFSLRNALENQIQAQQTTQTIRVLGYIGSNGSTTTAGGGLGLGMKIGITVAASLLTTYAFLQEEPEPLGIPVVPYGGEDLEEHASHIFAAQTGYGFTRSRRDTSTNHLPLFNAPAHVPIASLLTKRSGEWNRTWLGRRIPTDSPEILNYQSANPNVGYARDEYPFATTVNGGRRNYDEDKVSLKVVSNSESGRQGYLMGEFYGDPRVSLTDGDPIAGSFGVVAIPFRSVRSGYFRRDGSFRQI